jgi:hypothetical protein
MKSFFRPAPMDFVLDKRLKKGHAIVFVLVFPGQVIVGIE